MCVPSARQLLSSLARNGRQAKLKPKTSCETKRDLLVEYLSSLERLKVAEWEHKELLTAGMGDGVALRSAQRIEAIKSLGRNIPTTAVHTAVKQPLDFFPVLAGSGANVTDLQNGCVGQCFGPIHTRLAIYQHFRWGLSTRREQRSSWTGHSTSVCFSLSCISPALSFEDNWRSSWSVLRLTSTNVRSESAPPLHNRCCFPSEKT
jgi:hypothetical protein